MKHQIHSLQGIAEGKYREARRLRREMTPSEQVLWMRLRRNQVAGCHFRRQHVIRGFIADFYYHQAKLIIEVDGEIHNRNPEKDLIRDEILRSEGYFILRIPNERIEKELAEVVKEIEEVCIQRIRQLS